MEYSEAFKSKMIGKMLAPKPKSACALEKETGVSQPTLSRWLRESQVVDESMSQRTKRWTTSEKLRVLVEAGKLDDAKLGEFLRTEGLHEALLRRWRAGAEAALAEVPKRQRRSPEAQRIKELERELRRKDRALAEVSAILVLKKKAAAIWGEEDDSTQNRSEP